jgi:hypothetical protein
MAGERNKTERNYPARQPASRIAKESPGPNQARLDRMNWQDAAKQPLKTKKQAQAEVKLEKLSPSAVLFPFLGQFVDTGD